MDIDYEKLNNCCKKVSKLNNVMSEIFSDKSNVVYVFGTNENEILEKLENEYGLTKENIVSIGYGGYLHIKDLENFKNLNKYIKGVKSNWIKSNNYNICGLYLNRLWDYESRYSMDYSDAINDLKYYLGINNINEIDNNLLEMLKLTERYYEREFDRLN